METANTKTSNRIRAGLAASLLAIVGWSSPALAQQIKLRVADSFPAGHYISEVATKYWMSEVTRATNNAVAFEYFPAEQLGKAKDLLALTASGVVDIGYVAPSYISDKLPLSGVAELPGGFPTACAGSAAYWKLAKDGGVLAAKEFAPNGVRLLFAFVLPPYQLYLSKAKFENLKSLDGLKIRPTSGAVELLRKLNAVPVQIPAPEVYESLSRGTIDGVLFPIASIFSYNLQGLLKTSVIGESFGSFVITYAISEKRWKTLPPNVQKAMSEAGEATVRRACAYVDDNEAKDIDRLRKLGTALVELPASDKKTLAEMMRGGGTVWAQTLDKRGKPGTEVLNAFRAALPMAK
jgi:TRAP-type C4-dicarboxylate transport system substrate-binding protein